MVRGWKLSGIYYYLCPCGGDLPSRCVLENTVQWRKSHILSCLQNEEMRSSIGNNCSRDISLTLASCPFTFCCISKEGDCSQRDTDDTKPEGSTILHSIKTAQIVTSSLDNQSWSGSSESHWYNTTGSTGTIENSNKIRCQYFIYCCIRPPSYRYTKAYTHVWAVYCRIGLHIAVTLLGTHC